MIFLTKRKLVVLYEANHQEVLQIKSFESFPFFLFLYIYIYIYHTTQYPCFKLKKMQNPFSLCVLVYKNTDKEAIDLYTLNLYLCTVHHCFLLKSMQLARKPSSRVLSSVVVTG